MAYYSNITYPYQQSDADAAGGRGSISEELAAIKADIAYLYTFKMKTEDPVFTGNISGNSGTIPLLHGPVTLSDGDLSVSCNLYANNIKANGSLYTENIVNLNNITVKPNSTLSINGNTTINNGNLTVPNERVTGQSVVNCLSVTDSNCGIHNSGPYYLNSSTVQESGYTTVDAAIKNMSISVGDIDSIRVYSYCCPLFAQCTKFPILYGSYENYSTNYQNIASNTSQYYCVPENKFYLSNIQTGNINAAMTISANSLTSNSLAVNGAITADSLTTGTISATSDISGNTASFNSIATTLVSGGTNALLLCGCGNSLSVDCFGACLTRGRIWSPALCGCTACISDTANITTANICTVCIDTANIGSLKAVDFSYDNVYDNLKIGNTSSVVGYKNYIINGYNVIAAGCATFINSVATADVSVPMCSVFINGSVNTPYFGGVYINGSNKCVACGTVGAHTELNIGSILAACVHGNCGSLNCDFASAILDIFSIPQGGQADYIYSFPFIGYICKSNNPYINITATSRIEYCFDSNNNKLARIVEQHGCCYDFRSNCTSAEAGDWTIRGMIYTR